MPSQIKLHTESHRWFGSRRGVQAGVVPLPSAVTQSRATCGTPSGRAAGWSPAALHRLTIAMLCSRQCALRTDHPAIRCMWLYL